MDSSFIFFAPSGAKQRDRGTSNINWNRDDTSVHLSTYQLLIPSISLVAQLINMALKIEKASASPYSEGLKSPVSLTPSSVTLQATVENLKHVFQKALHDLTIQDPPNTPELEDNSNSTLNMDDLKELLVKLVRKEYASARFAMKNKADPSVSDSNVTEKKSEMVEKMDLETLIRTTPDDFSLFRKWASAPKFKKVLETYARLTIISFCFDKKLTLT